MGKKDFHKSSISYKGGLKKKKKKKKQAGAGVVPSSGLVNSLVKIEFLTIDVV